MILPKDHSNVFILSVTVFLLSISSASPSADNVEEAEQGNVSFTTTGYAAHNPFPPDILERMRAELMVVMGVEPEEAEEADKKQKTGH